jgi:hypothetical protein
MWGIQPLLSYLPIPNHIPGERLSAIRHGGVQRCRFYSIALLPSTVDLLKYAMVDLSTSFHVLDFSTIAPPEISLPKLIKNISDKASFTNKIFTLRLVR